MTRLLVEDVSEFLFHENTEFPISSLNYLRTSKGCFPKGFAFISIIGRRFWPTNGLHGLKVLVGVVADMLVGFVFGS